MTGPDSALPEAPDAVDAGAAEDTPEEPRDPSRLPDSAPVDPPEASPDKEDETTREAAPIDPETALGRVDAACHRPIVEAWRGLEERLDKDTVGAITEAREKHEALLDAVGLREPAPERWEDRDERLLEYRRKLASDVFEPLLGALGRTPPLGTIHTGLSSSLDAAVSACRELPAMVSEGYPPGALSSRPSDSFSRRAGKMLARLVSGARKPGRERNIPLRALALRHLDEVVTPQLDQLTERTLRLWAEWVHEVEGSIVEWADEALAALVRSPLPTDSAADDEEDGEGRPPDDWSVIAAAATQMNDRLRALGGETPADEADESACVRLEASRARLGADLAVAGSFLFEPRAPDGRPRLKRAERLKAAVAAWDEGLTARLKVGVSLLAVLSGVSAVQQRLVYRMRERALAGSDILPEVAASLDELRETFERSTTPLPKRMAELEPAVESALEPALDAIPRQAAVDETVQASSDSMVETLPALVRQVPTSLNLVLEEGTFPTGTRKVETRVLPLQDLARQSFDVLRIEKIRASTNSLPGAVAEVRAGVEELPNVFSFAFEAAEGELEADEEGARERAQELILNAMTSVAESLRKSTVTLEGAVNQVRGRLATELGAGSIALIDRVAAGRMQARLLAARSQFADLRSLIAQRWGPPAQRAFRALSLRWALARRFISRGLRKGSAIVSGTTGAEGASARSIRTLTQADEIIAKLPLVYQRLFTLDALTDPTLLAARTQEIADAMARWHRWNVKDGVPLVVRGRQGSGVTSFLNALASHIDNEDGRETTIAQIRLDGRIEDEATLAGILADSFGLEPVETLDELSRQIFDAPVDGVPDVAVVDDLEHLFLREPGGTDLIERLLTLMAETEPRTFWISGITTSAWQLIETSEPTAISQIDVLHLEPLGSDGLRTALMLRHRRSGLPIRFHEPEEGRRLLRRRLRRMRDPAAYTELLETDFIEQLNRTSSGNLRLAIFQWLLSADFEAGDGVLMTAPERPDFSILDSLGHTQNFSLKAFLEHRTLSLAEHDRVFRLPRHESYQIFESLGNRHLIEEVARDKSKDTVRSEIEVDLRYRLRPLLVGAIVDHLRGRNIVH